jgi:hypothetical protein
MASTAVSSCPPQTQTVIDGSRYKSASGLIGAMSPASDVGRELSRIFNQEPKGQNYDQVSLFDAAGLFSRFFYDCMCIHTRLSAVLMRTLQTFRAT